eukprot:Partr_v1_DN24881_c0_g1_i2_m29766 putative cdp-diacylglycerol--inositol 3-phosphatidyltransferase
MTSVYWYAPNVVGYLRIMLLGMACYWMPTNPWLTIAAYSLSCLLDAIDGHLARLLNQCTKFGAALDMVIDRSTTTCLLLYLSRVHPEWMPLFQALIALDFTSHYMQMYSTVASGGSNSHKAIESHEPWLLKMYYGNNKILFSLCALNELFWLLVYLWGVESSTSGLGDVERTRVLWLAMWVGPWCGLKHVMNFLQLIAASRRLVVIDTLSRDGSVASTENKKPARRSSGRLRKE